ncbi:MAG: gephyrin-like molybdotransferase Glp [Trueperaceae bacterium]|nr:gephyrin-like molybdotransferase Glp [Trueperaceae bacterium]
MIPKNYPTQLSVPEAIEIVRAEASRFESEEQPLLSAYGRVLAADLASQVDHPSCNNSALDGYACRAADTTHASEDNPVRLNVVGDVPAGSVFEGTINPGEAVGIYTGAPVPDDVDAIIAVEQTERDGDAVLIRRPASPNDIRPRGQDIRAGEIYLTEGTRLGPAQIGVAASMGYARLPVVRIPKIGILSTGDEVIEPGQPIRDGQVYNSNSYSVASLVRQAGAEPVILPRAVDDPAVLRDTLENLGGVDLLVTSGGVSMGKYDFVRDLLFGEGEVLFWKVAIRPGGPALFGRWQGLPVFGLPGNPVSSMVVFMLITRAWIDKALGSASPLPYHRRIVATAACDFKGAGFKEAFRRSTVRLDSKTGTYSVDTTGNQSSGVLTSMTQADGLAVVPPYQDVSAGDRIEVIVLNEGFY